MNDLPIYLLKCTTLIQIEVLCPKNDGGYAWLNHENDSIYILPYPSISVFTTNELKTWFLPRELNFEDTGDDNDKSEDDDIQIDDNIDAIPFEAEDPYDHPIQQMPQYFHSYSLGAQFHPPPQYQQFLQKHEPEYKLPLDI